MTTPTALFVAATIVALALVFGSFGPTYSLMPFGTNGTAALRLDGHTGKIDVCSFVKESTAENAKSHTTCGPTWPK